MAEQYYPFDEGPGASVTENLWEVMAKHFRRTGIAGDTSSTSLKVVPSASTRTSNVSPGEGFVLGMQYTNSANIPLVHDPNDTGSPRIDLVVLRRDRALNQIYPTIRKGTPAGTPVAPAPLGNHGTYVGFVDSGDIYDVPLAQVTILPSVSVISSQHYTDVRWMGDFATTTGYSTTRNSNPAMRPMGSLHYESDTRRWVGWDGFKWGIIAEQGPWQTYNPKVYWNFTSGGLVQDTNWNVHGRWRYIADNTVAFTLSAYTSAGIPSGPQSYPNGALQISLPVKAGAYPSGHDTLINGIFRPASDASKTRPAACEIWRNSDLINRVWISHVTGTPDSQTGTFDAAYRDAGWSNGSGFRFSGIYETEGA